MRFTDSRCDKTFGGNAYIILSNETIEVRFVRDREQLFLDFRATGHRRTRSWYSMDVVRQLLTGEIGRSEMDEENATFLKSRFPEIQERFAKPRIAETEANLKAFEAARAKRLFG